MWWTMALRVEIGRMPKKTEECAKKREIDRSGAMENSDSIEAWMVGWNLR